MESILKMTLVETVVADLRNRIETGRMKGTLPGVRRLSQALGVSVPTLCRALHELRQKGLIEGGAGRRWQVMGSAPGLSSNDRSGSRTERKNRSGRVLFLASLPLSGERHSGVEIFAELLDQLGTKGWEVMHRVVPFALATTPRKSWDDLLKLTRPDSIVILGGTPVFGKWARDKGVRILFVGGDAGQSGAALLMIRISTMLRFLLTHLLELGHRRIVLPLCGRGAQFVSKCREVVNETLIASKSRPGGIVIAETTYEGPEVVVNLVRGLWRKQRPDALIFLDWREFVAASSYFKQSGIEIPRDVSVVILSRDSSMDWHLPLIAHFEYPAKRMARMISKWVMTRKSSDELEAVVEVQARWVEGESIQRRKFNVRV